MFNFESLSNFAKLILSDMPMRGKEIGQDTFDNGDAHVFIDTCFANDTCMYETAIRINNGEIVIVEEYGNPDDAKIGHESWVNACKQKTFSFYSVQTGEMYVYEV